MKIDDYIKKIKKLGACNEAVKAAHSYKTSQDLWKDCKRGDWMLWLIGHFANEPWSEKRKKLTLASCECARLVWDLMSKASQKCIEIFERWGSGEDISQARLQYAAAYAYAAADAADAADAAAYAAAYAAADAAA